MQQFYITSQKMRSENHYRGNTNWITNNVVTSKYFIFNKINKNKTF